MVSRGPQGTTSTKLRPIMALNIPFSTENVPPNRRFIGFKEMLSPDAGKDWGQKENRPSEDEMAGWHHRHKGHELGQTPGDGEGQGGLACCSPWGPKQSDMTEWLNNNKPDKGFIKISII